jgi:hypothetical protein
MGIMRIIRNLVPWQKHKIIVRLHPSGWIFILLTIAIGVVAVNSGNNIVFLIVSTLLSLMLLSGCVAYYNLRGLEISPLKSCVLTAGEESTLGFEIRNSKRIPAILIELRLEGKGDVIPILPSTKSLTLRIPWTPAQRGLVPWPECILGSSFPFGFIWRGGQRSISESLVVAPSRRHHKISLLDEEKNDDAKKKRQEGHGEWYGIRPHKPGEGPGNIIWKKIDWHLRSLWPFPQPYPARSFASDNETPLLMDWFDPALSNLDTEERLSALRFLLEHAVSMGKAWRLRMPDGNCDGFAKHGKKKALMLLALHKPLPGKIN